MTKPLSALLVAAGVVSGVAACVTPPAVSVPVDYAASTPTAQTPSDATTLMMRGTIANYDASTRVLSLSTANGTVQFPVPLAARIRLNGHTVTASDLDGLQGRPAAVRYSQSSGTKTVESVHVLERANR